MNIIFNHSLNRIAASLYLFLDISFFSYIHIYIKYLHCRKTITNRTNLYNYGIFENNYSRRDLLLVLELIKNRLNVQQENKH